MLTQKLLSVSLLGTEWIICLLILSSVFSLAIMVERIFFLRKKKGDIAALKEKIRPFLTKGDVANIKRFLKEDSSSAAQVAYRSLTDLQDSYAEKDVEDALSIILTEERLLLESRIAFLGTIASMAPFVGLLGTVLGIINAFHGLSVNKQGGDMVMAGISESLVATALGLFVAIPAGAGYNYFIRYIKRIMVGSQNFCRQLLLDLKQKKA